MDIELQPPGVMWACESDMAYIYWQPGRWKRDKLRGKALSDDELDMEPIDIFRAPFHVGWLLERIAHDGEWCDPQWPVYEVITSPPKPRETAIEASWLEL